MPTADIVDVDGSQVVKLPAGIRFEGRQASVRKVGKALVLEPVKPESWPEGFFEQIAIDEPAFVRPEQGSVRRALADATAPCRG
jgi:virulence-associated protein VagC